jgi:hypothetical protein
MLREAVFRRTEPSLSREATCPPGFKSFRGQHIFVALPALNQRVFVMRNDDFAGDVLGFSVPVLETR